MLNLHPLFIHFPIALLTVGFLFDLIGVLLKKESLNNAGWWCQLAGIFGGAVAVGTGLWAESTVPHGGASHELMENHKILAIISFSILFVAFIWRAVNKSKLPESKQILVGYFVLNVIGMGFLLYGAHLGGKLVYEYGVGGSAVKQPQGHHDHHDGHDHSH